MKTSNKILLGLLAAIALNVLTGMVFLRNSLSPAGIGNGKQTVEAKGPKKKVRLTANGFRRLSVGDNYEIELVQGEEFIEIEAAENIVDLFEVELDGDVLKIDAKREYTIIPTERITIKLGFKELEKIDLWGNTKVLANNSLEMNRLEIGIHGSGQADLPINAQRLEMNISGAGRGNFTGTVEKFNLIIAGAGQVKADEINIKKADVRISGAGYAIINVEENLDVVTSGSGVVHYKGDPKVSKRSTGAGGVFKK